MIKVTLGEANTQEKPFPKLMIATDTGRIVFFICERKGFQLNTVDRKTFKEQHYSEYWSMTRFVDYNEPITLQNA